jgi:sodium/bile acid cotransporter 7
MNLLRRLHIDPFLLAIVTAAAIGTLFPVTGWGITAADWTANAFVFALFYLFGARLSTKEALAGLKNWRLHLVILGFTFVLFPLLGQGAALLAKPWLGTTLATGVMYLAIVPSTVQSSIAFTSIAKGNVAGAIVAASTSNLLGVFLTPALAWLLLAGEHFAVSASSIIDIAVQIFLPFLLGQLTRRWTGAWILAHPKLKLIDHGTVVVVVYTAFAAGMREHMWEQVTWAQILVVLVISLALLGTMLCLTWLTAKRLRFNRADAIAIQFCGTKKSLATGLPMAGVLFASMPVGLLILPLMVFHQAQLMACATLASRYGKQAEAGADAETGES